MTLLGIKSRVLSGRGPGVGSRGRHEPGRSEMPHATHTVVIARRRAEVFDFLADAENDPSWRPSVVSIHRDGPLGVGAPYVQRTAGPLGRPIAADIEVTEYQPDTRVAF